MKWGLEKWVLGEFGLVEIPHQEHTKPDWWVILLWWYAFQTFGDMDQFSQTIETLVREFVLLEI